MRCNLAVPCRSHLPALLICLAVAGLTPLPAQVATDDPRSPAALYLVDADANSLTLSRAAQGRTCQEPNLVVITHGWYEREPWPERMALAIAARVDREKWCCGWCDWRGLAKRLRPSQAATIGRDTIGPHLGRKIVGLSKDWQHVHFIGHSAGAWVVNGAAEIVAAETTAEIHITFLDAYVPDGWDANALGKLADRPGKHRWVEHYFTRDLLNLTENRLSRAHNVDITGINPGFKGHKFPWHWYLATVVGQYTTDARLTDKPVVFQAEGLAYGFARARENGPPSWAESLALKPGDRPVRIRPPEDFHPSPADRPIPER
ncbi:MAG: hypothetical protein JSW27_24490 [Phycisphaerales bacterium]|nr:MAG: hypothetical protein JSW27_24490 [Phycisphaerales bacterium]